VELRLNTGTKIGDLVDVSGTREGGGAVFRLTLPQKDPPPAAAPAEPTE